MTAGSTSQGSRITPPGRCGLEVPLERVARLLANGAVDAGTAILRITQWDIAAGGGFSRQTVSRALARLEERGAITRGRGEVRVRDAVLLRAAGTA
jgi:CRP-like cAMP-binding protein